MGVFMDAMQQEMAACVRDSMRCDERALFYDTAEYWFREDLYRTCWDMLAPRIVIPELYATIPIDMGSWPIANIGVPMDGFGESKGLESYDGPTTAGATMVRMNTMKSRIDQAVKNAQSQLTVAREAQEILERNPDLEKLLDLMQRGRF